MGSVALTRRGGSASDAAHNSAVPDQKWRPATAGEAVIGTGRRRTAQSREVHLCGDVQRAAYTGNDGLVTLNHRPSSIAAHRHPDRQHHADHAPAAPGILREDAYPTSDLLTEILTSHRAGSARSRKIARRAVADRGGIMSDDLTPGATLGDQHRCAWRRGRRPAHRLRGGVLGTRYRAEGTPIAVAMPLRAVARRLKEAWSHGLPLLRVRPLTRAIRRVRADCLLGPARPGHGVPSRGAGVDRYRSPRASRRPRRRIRPARRPSPWSSTRRQWP